MSIAILKPMLLFSRRLPAGHSLRGAGVSVSPEVFRELILDLHLAHRLESFAAPRLKTSNAACSPAPLLYMPAVVRLSEGVRRLCSLIETRGCDYFEGPVALITPRVILRLAEFKAAVRKAAQDAQRGDGDATDLAATACARMLMIAGIPDRFGPKQLLVRYLDEHGYSAPLLGFLRRQTAAVPGAGCPDSLEEFLDLTTDKAALDAYATAFADAQAAVRERLAPAIGRLSVADLSETLPRSAHLSSHAQELIATLRLRSLQTGAADARAGASTQVASNPDVHAAAGRLTGGAALGSKSASLLRGPVGLSLAMIALAVAGWAVYDHFRPRVGPADGTWVLYSTGDEVQAALDTASFRKAGTRTLTYRTAWVMRREGRSVVSLVSLDCINGARESIARHTWDNRRFSGDFRYSVAVVELPRLADANGSFEHDMLSVACRSVRF